MFSYLILSREVFSLSKDNGIFHRYHRRRLPSPSNSSIFLSPTSVTTRSVHCYYQQLNPKPLYFYHLAGVRVAAVQEEASLNEKSKRTAIHHQLLVPSGRIVRGSVPQMLRYIYAQPQNRRISGDAKQILPLTGDAAALVPARMPKLSSIGGWGLGCCLLNAYAPTRVQ